MSKLKALAVLENKELLPLNASSHRLNIQDGKSNNLKKSQIEKIYIFERYE